METLEKYFTDLTPLQENQFAALKDLYKEWNEKINVISRKDMDNFYIHHVLHSLAIAAKFNFEKGMQVMDLGSGGGLPGIPLAIFFPDVQFLLVDSINKKLNVIKAISNAIGLKNISTEHIRAEEIKGRQFDFVVSRAVAPLNDLWRWSCPLLRRGVKGEVGLISLKGGDLTKEIFESGCKPHVWEIEKIFKEDYFKEKYILFVPK